MLRGELLCGVGAAAVEATARVASHVAVKIRDNQGLREQLASRGINMEQVSRSFTAGMAALEQVRAPGL